MNFSESGFDETTFSSREGHRERARQRFLKVGGESLEDYELLELALQMLLPRRDTKSLAKTLLARFGSFSAVFSAPLPRLAEVKGLGELSRTHLKVMQAVAQRYARDQVDREAVTLSSWSALLD
jgi:DNA repair protein RadC